MDIFHVVHHETGAAKGASALLIRVLLVTDAKYALRLVADNGNLHGRRGGVRAWTFFLASSLTGLKESRSLGLLLKSKSNHQVDSTDLAADDVLYVEVRREVAEDPLQAGPLPKLMLNNRLDVHVSHMRLV